MSITQEKSKKKMSTEEYQRCLLEEMRFFDEYCRNHRITYYLIFGSLLGAVRHNGFIPWDDDLDIIIPRADYMRLIETFADERYQIVSIHNNPDFTAPLAKLIDTRTYLKQNYGYREKVELGVYIDLWILDGLPNDKGEADKYEDMCRDLVHKWTVTNFEIFRSPKSIIKDTIRFLYYLPCHLKGYKYYLKRLDEVSQRYRISDSQFVGNLAYANTRDVWYKEDFIPVEHEFQGYSFFIPKGYDRILTIRYGNWRKYPPDIEQQPHHDFVCYWK